MCGLAFLWHQHQSGDRCAALAGAALDRMRHRGPDERQVVSGPGWALGHNRLSVIDLASSRQPMSSPDGRYLLAFNGEIYNYQSLRQQLQQRWDFKTSGDTEVVLAGLVLEGSSFVRKMSGMWAFTLLDSREQRLLLSRDRCGEKPLYYLARPGLVAVASELPALKQMVPAAPLQENGANSLYFFRHGFFPPGATIYREVHEVLPAHCLELQLASGTCHSECYWSLPSGTLEIEQSEAEYQLNSLLDQSIQSRLVADVEVGLLLSGGIDSSILLAKMRPFNAPRTFTIGFSSGSYDERDDARRVAEHFRVSNVQQVVDKFEPAAIGQLLRDNIGQPFADPSILPTAMACRLASSQVKVCLGGDGADELFSGYQRYQARLLSSWYRRLPLPLRNALAGMLAALPASHSHHSRSLVKKAQLFVRLVEQFGSLANRNTPRLLSSEAESGFFAGAFAEIDDSANTQVLDGDLDEVMAMMLDDLSVYLPQDILLKSDRASMAHSLELRSPFLDEKLVEFAFSLPRSWHRRGTRGKRMLRGACGGELPDFVWQKRKQGFAVPVGEWFLGATGAQLQAMLHDDLYPASIAAGVLQLLNAHRQRQADYGLALWSFYTYGYWKLNERA